MKKWLDLLLFIALIAIGFAAGAWFRPADTAPLPPAPLDSVRIGIYSDW